MKEQSSKRNRFPIASSFASAGSVQAVGQQEQALLVYKRMFEKLMLLYKHSSTREGEQKRNIDRAYCLSKYCVNIAVNCKINVKAVAYLQDIHQILPLAHHGITEQRCHHGKDDRRKACG